MAMPPASPWRWATSGAVCTDLGRHPEALAATEEAVGLWRPLARDNPAHQPDLAGGADQPRDSLAELGRYPEALAATEEAVGLWRPLARDNPAHQPGLARRWATSGRSASTLGRHREALAAAEEALGLWRALARDNPAHQPRLARALDSLGIDLRRPGPSPGGAGRHRREPSACGGRWPATTPPTSPVSPGR